MSGPAETITRSEQPGAMELGAMTRSDDGAIAPRMLYTRPPAVIDRFGSSALDQAFLDESTPWSPALARATHPLVTRSAEGLPRRRFTVTEVEAMGAAGIIAEDERVELVGGELVPMPAKGNRHEVVKVALLERWYRSRPDDVSLAPETTFRLSEDTYLEPDVVVYDRVGGLNSLSGPRVLLVIEIADTSLRWDTGRKAALYAGFGVRDLWVIDAVRLTTRVLRQPSADGYLDARDVAAAEPIVPLVAPDAFTLRLADLDVA